jgi:integrase/recombinase XerD
VTALAPLLQAFFTDRLMTQRAASANTVAAYRTSLRLLVCYAAASLDNKPGQLDFADLDAPMVTSFLEYLEAARLNSARTRNNRLAAIHSLFAYAALRHPEHAASIQPVLAIPPKRHENRLLIYLTDDEVDALLAACNLATRTGRRDQAMLTLAVQTGLRISELAALTHADLVLGTGANVHTTGKGRKERRTPLTATTADILRSWLTESGAAGNDPLLPTTTGRHLSRDAIEHRIALYAGIAAERCPSMRSKHITAHTLRHTCAMRLLNQGVDVAVIALWLGHSQVSTTNIYLHADMNQKERALARLAPLGAKPVHYRAPDTLLAFLEGL